MMSNTPRDPVEPDKGTRCPAPVVAMRILVVEDDETLCSQVVQGLREHGYTAEGTNRLRSARRKLQSFPPDFVLLDLGLPDGNGLEFLADLRSTLPVPYVLITTARDAESDRVSGLDAGADDYLVKPYSFPELLARLRAFSRRRTPLAEVLEVSVAELRARLADRKAWCGNSELQLTPREFDLLVCLMRRPGEVIPRTVFAAEVWKSPSRFTPLDNLIDVNVSRLRNKLAESGCSLALNTVRGVGYQLGGEA